MMTTKLQDAIAAHFSQANCEDDLADLHCTYKTLKSLNVGTVVVLRTVCPDDLVSYWHRGQSIDYDGPRTFTYLGTEYPTLTAAITAVLDQCGWISY